MFENNDEKIVEKFAYEVRKKIPSLVAAAIFGSVARGSPGDSSDIDVLLVFDDEKPERFTTTVSNIAASTKSERDIQPILTNLTDVEPSFLSRVLREGKIIFGKIVVEGNKILRPMKIIRYYTKGTNRSTATRISQIAHGYVTRKRVGKKEYVSKVKGVGWAPARGLVILPEENAKVFEKTLKEKNVKFELFEIWM